MTVEETHTKTYIEPYMYKGPLPEAAVNLQQIASREVLISWKEQL